MLLKPADDRDVTQARVSEMIAAREPRDIRPACGCRSARETGSKLQITLAGDDPNALNLAASAVERDLRTLPGLGNVTSSASLMKPEIVIRPLPDRAAELGVTTDTLSTVTRIATSGDVENSLGEAEPREPPDSDSACSCRTNRAAISSAFVCFRCRARTARCRS